MPLSPRTVQIAAVALTVMVAGCARQGTARAPRIAPAHPSPAAARTTVADQSTATPDPHIATAPHAFAAAVELARPPHAAPNWYVKDKGRVTLHLRGSSKSLALTFIGWPGDAGTVPHETVRAGQTLTIRFTPPCPGVFALATAGGGDPTIYGILNVEGPHGTVDDGS